MNNKRIILRVQSVETILMYLFLSLFFTGLIFIINAVVDYAQGLSEAIYILLALFSIFFFFCFLNCILQFAIVDNVGIEIKRLCFQVVLIKWSEIYSIHERSLVTHTGRTSVYFYWLVISRDKSTSKNIKNIYRVGRNKRNSLTWFIIASKKNKAIINSRFEAATGKTVDFNIAKFLLEKRKK